MGWMEILENLGNVHSPILRSVMDMESGILGAGEDYVGGERCRISCLAPLTHKLNLRSGGFSFVQESERKPLNGTGIAVRGAG